MSNTRTRVGPDGAKLRQRYPAHGSKPRHFRLDSETVRQLEAAMAWYETRSMSYSESCLVRLAIRDLLEHLEKSSPGDEGDIIRRAERARRGQ